MLPSAASLVAAAALALLAGCGGDDEEPDRPDASAGEATELEITLDADGSGDAPRVADVSCADGSGGGAECDAVEALPDDAADPVPPGTACTEIYGGPDLVRVEGTLRGEEVKAELTRENGCEIDRFDRFLPLLRELFDGYRPGESLSP